MRMTKEVFDTRVSQIESQTDLDPIENLFALSELQAEYIESLEEHNLVQEDIIKQYQYSNKKES